MSGQIILLPQAKYSCILKGADKQKNRIIFEVNNFEGKGMQIKKIFTGCFKHFTKHKHALTVQVLLKEHSIP